MLRSVLTVFLVLISAGICLGNSLILPADPPASRTVPLQEIWRIGGEEDEDILLGVITDGALDDSGRIYLLDNQLAQVLVISPGGELITTVGREGEGPGELRRPSRVILMPEGRIGVLGGRSGKIVLLNLDGTPGGEINFNKEATDGGFYSLRRMKMVGDLLVGVYTRWAFDQEAGTSTMVNCLASFNRQGEELHRFGEFSQVNDFQNPVIDEAGSFSPFRVWTACASGPVYTTPERDAYRIQVSDLEGNTIRDLTRDFPLRKRSQEDKDRLSENFRMIINGRRVVPENKALDHDPAIAAFAVAADGRLFVTNCYQSERLLPAGVAGRFDIISPEGSFSKELTLTLEGCDPEQDQLIFLDGEHFLVVYNLKSARDSMRAGMGQEDEAEISEDIEPLEVGFYVLGK